MYTNPHMIGCDSSDSRHVFGVVVGVLTGLPVPVLGHGVLLERPGHRPLQLLLRRMGPGGIHHTQGEAWTWTRFPASVLVF